jgi:D-sedoheptulose 7-phosphate isomerase
VSEDSYLGRLNEILANPVIELEVRAVVEHLKMKISQGNTIWIMGNGGSASTAEHFETDLSFIRKNHQKSIVRSAALTANSSITTAISNDIGFEYVFSHQIERKASAGDVCILISASGNSSNLLEATRVSKLMDLSTVAIIGFDGGKLLNECDLRVFTKSILGDYGPVEDSHLAICHFIAEELKLQLFEDL